MYIYIYIYTLTYHISKCRRGERRDARQETKRWYTRSPLEDSHLFGPSPWKILAANNEKNTSEQPSPWRKSSKRESCYGDRVYHTQWQDGWSAVGTPTRNRLIVLHISIYIYIYT